MTHLPLRSFHLSDAGLVHLRNEDQCAVFDTDDGGRVLLVCDGMGGMGRGDEASALAVETLRTFLKAPALTSDRPVERLVKAVRAADDEVRAGLYVAGQAAQPGSTAVAAYVRQGQVSVCWVGDSRAYLFRDRGVVARTRDHKLVEDLVEAGQMSAEDARTSTLAHVVTRALGGKTPEEASVTPQALPSPWCLQQGDRLLVCSDGLTDLVDDDELGPLVMDGEPEVVCRRLVDLANDRGGHDNITVIVGIWDGPDTPTSVEDEFGPEITEPSVDPKPGRASSSEPPDVAAIARELMPWWVATGVLLLGAGIAAVAAALTDPLP